MELFLGGCWHIYVLKANIHGITNTKFSFWFKPCPMKHCGDLHPNQEILQGIFDKGHRKAASNR